MDLQLCSLIQLAGLSFGHSSTGASPLTNILLFISRIIVQGFLLPRVILRGDIKLPHS